LIYCVFHFQYFLPPQNLIFLAEFLIHVADFLI
jgi:hypothetical protein